LRNESELLYDWNGFLADSCILADSGILDESFSQELGKFCKMKFL
jgi:hypothetical protein